MKIELIDPPKKNAKFIGSITDGISDGISAGKDYLSSLNYQEMAVSTISDTIGDRGKNLGGEDLTYPSNIDSPNSPHDNYLIFTCVRAMSGGGLNDRDLKARQDSFLANPTQIQSTLARIRLYMPNMNEVLGHKYSAKESDLFGEIAMELISGYMNDQSVAETGGAVAGRVVDKLTSAGMGKLGQTATQTVGQIYNQRSVSLYDGTELRSHTFNYNLRARNLVELKAISNIIHAFRRLSSGSIGTDLLTAAIGATATELTGSETALKRHTTTTINVPPFWYVEERVKSNAPRFVDRFLFGPAVITGVRVNKTPESQYQSLSGTGGDPVNIELEISMKEIVPVYSNFWDKVRTFTRGQ